MAKQLRAKGEFSSVATAIPRVDPARVNWVIIALLLGGLVAIVADSYMSWLGFETLPIDWWVSVTLTAIIAISQLGSGVIQALGGNPFSGVGGDTDNDKVWGMIVYSLYGIDIFSNFQGFGGGQYMNIDLIWADPVNSLGMILWYLTLSVLLAFGDEILLRQKDRIEIAAHRNRIMYEKYMSNVKSLDAAMETYQANAIEKGRSYGANLNPEIDWINGGRD